MLSETDSMRRGVLKLLILRLLANEKLYGYSLRRAIIEHSNGLWTPSPGSIYPALRALEKEGYIIARDEGNKKVYKVTAKGRKSSDKAVESLKKMNRFIDKILAI